MNVLELAAREEARMIKARKKMMEDQFTVPKGIGYNTPDAIFKLAFSQISNTELDDSLELLSAIPKGVNND